MSDTDTEDQTPKKRRKMRAVSLISAADGYDGANSKAAPQLQGHKAKEVPGTATGTLHPVSYLPSKRSCEKPADDQNLAGFRRAGGDEAEEGSSTKFGSNEGKRTKFKAPTPLRASTSSIGHSLTDIKVSCSASTIPVEWQALTRRSMDPPTGLPAISLRNTTKARQKVSVANAPKRAVAASSRPHLPDRPRPNARLWPKRPSRDP